MLYLTRTTALLLFACILAGVNGYSQTITLSRNNVPLTRIFKDIESQTNFVFFFERKLLRDAKTVTIEVSNVSLKEALDKCFNNQQLEYVITGKTITVKRPPPTASTSPPDAFSVVGKIVNNKNEPVPGATVSVKETDLQLATNEQGEFVFDNIKPKASLLVTSVNFENQEIDIDGRKELNIVLQKRVSELSDVVVSNGFQDLRKGNTTGSFVKIDNTLFNRRVSVNVIDRLEGVSNGVLFNKNIQPETNQSSLSIRGRSTIFAYPEPLIILDNFPYTGDINNINPNDVESVTILKDAAAASIWGAYSGNGVIVITSKKGNLYRPVKVSFNTNVAVAEKPNPFYKQILSSSEYIDVEQYLFNQGYYNSSEPVQNGRPLTPAVEIMIKRRDGVLTPAQAEAQLSVLRQQDKRNDLKKYFYRNGVNQQYAINLNGGGPSNHYYFSAGYDRSLPALRGETYRRVTLNGSHSYFFFNKKLELSTGIIFTSVKSRFVNEQNLVNPYTLYADANGNPLTVAADLRQPYKDTAGRSYLLDWNYRPLEELRLSDRVATTTDYRINIGLKYNILSGLNANVFYQYNKGNLEQDIFQSQQSYFTRNLINRFTDVRSGTAVRPIPLGGIYDAGRQKSEAHNIRGQINYNATWRRDHSLAAVAGAELRSYEIIGSRKRQYGYNKEQKTGQPVDYLSDFPLYYVSTLEKIPNMDLNTGDWDRYISYYLNAAYTWKQRYVLSASVRKDESNIFGVKANRKGVPLWSIGGSWEINKESFYNVSWLPFLKLRVTHGYTGNVDRSVSAYTTASIRGMNSYGVVPGLIVNPPNPALRWEKINMVNIGLEFSLKKDIVTGSIDYYIRRSNDLIGDSPLDPTTGATLFRGNTANMKGRGTDITINTVNIKRKLTWRTVLLFNYTADEITVYKSKQTTIGAYVNQTFSNPLAGNPLYSIYSYRWRGLDNQGDPVGFIDGHTSKDYNAIFNSTNFDNLQYSGSAVPIVFGSLRNIFSWKQFELSFIVTGKAGYYFRRSSINYSTLFLGQSEGHPDYNRRWKMAGDEQFTNVPSMRYPADGLRASFYAGSEILVEKGDHLRLQDIQISYDLPKRQLRKMPVSMIRFYLYANNLGILWRANKQGIDPDFITDMPNPRSYAAGVKVEF